MPPELWNTDWERLSVIMVLIAAVWAFWRGHIVPGPVHQAAVKDSEEKDDVIARFAEAFEILTRRNGI